MAKYVISFKRTCTVTNVIDASSLEEAERIADGLLESDFQEEIDERMDDCYDPDWEADAGELRDVDVESGWYENEYITPEKIDEYLGE